MSATALKIIATICMTLDHLSTFLGAPLPLRYIGRCAAVIFFFCAAESAVHTSNRKQYLLRLYKMSLLMTALSIAVPFILNGWFPSKQLPPVTNNIFTELVPGVWMLDILEDTKENPVRRKRRLRNFILYQLATIPAYLLLSMLLDSVAPDLPEQIIAWPLGSIFMTEGSIWLTLQIVLFYLWRDSKKKLAVGYFVYCALYALVMVPQLPARLFQFTHAHVPKFDMLVLNGLGLLGFEGMEPIHSLSESLLTYNFQCFMFLALPLLLFYNGKRGKGYKRLFYIYYPAHIYLLYIIQQFILT